MCKSLRKRNGFARLERYGSATAESGSNIGVDAIGSRLHLTVRCGPGMRPISLPAALLVLTYVPADARFDHALAR